MLEELDKLIEFIYSEYLRANQEWLKSTYYKRVYLNGKKISKLFEDKITLEKVFNYCRFVNRNNVQLLMKLKQFNSKKLIVNTRVKTKNSIEHKVELKNSEKMSVNKYLDDLFAVRVICKDKITYKEIKQLMQEKYEGLRCFNIYKKRYRAVHIYFVVDRCSFRWELQVWNEKDAIKNMNICENYKGEYLEWEAKSKEVTK